MYLPLKARGCAYYIDPTDNPVRKVARRAYREHLVMEYRLALQNHLSSEETIPDIIGRLLGLFDNVISSCEYRTSRAKPPTPSPVVKRRRTEWEEVV